ncbi:MAG TPA: proteasome activator [Actinomycetota bacterium]|nr:proteasome activator [Actinomycetota bacterium]
MTEQESPPAVSPTEDGERSAEGAFIDPQRLLRIAGVTREVLDEARRIRPEAAAVAHLREVHAQITNELREALPSELFKELDELTPEIRDGTLEELALAHAEILGWLEGLFQGTQMAIQMHAAQALQQQHRHQQPGALPSSPAEPAREADSRYL